VPIADEACLVMSVMFDIIHEVNPHLLVTFRNRIAVVDACIDETFVVI
jgi:hypothetical protein